MVSYKIGGKNGTKIELKESNDLLVLRLNSEVSDFPSTLNSSNRSLFNQIIKIADFKEANISVYRCMGDNNHSAKQVRNKIRNDFKSLDKVKFAGRALIDPSGIVNLYTENIFVKFKDKLSISACKKLIKKYKFKIKHRPKYATNAYFLESTEFFGFELFNKASELLAHVDVELCHPEIIKYKRTKGVFPNQWHLTKTIINGNNIDEHINVEAAWATTEGEGITIAIIDDGVDIDHPEFSGRNKIVAPKDMLPSSNDPRPKRSGDAHGTACAGVACGNGKFQASGVAPKAKLIPIRLVANLGSMFEADAIYHAVENGADIISCSWGPPDGNWTVPDDPRHTTPYYLPDSTRLAIDYAVENGREGKGCIITWAAGNGRENVWFDGYANYEKVLAISACNDRGKKSVYSDFGKNVICCFPSNDFEFYPFGNPKPLSEGIWTTDITGNYGYSFNDYHEGFGGTSSACPGAAGVIALMLSVNPNLTFDEVKEMIKLSCVKIDLDNANYDQNGHSIFYGYGRIDAKLAVDVAKNSIQSQPDFKITGIVDFKKVGSLELFDNQECRSNEIKDRVIGFKINLTPPVPGIGICYSLAYNSGIQVSSVCNGSLASLNDRRRKIIGMAIKLTGEHSQNYKVKYSALLKGEVNWIEAEDGEYCGTPGGRGPAIIALKVSIEKI